MLSRDNIANYKSFGVPVLVFLVIVVLSVTVARSMFLDVRNTMAQIDQLAGVKLILSNKRDLLKSLDENVLSKKAQVAVLAVPANDSSLAAISTVRVLAHDKNINIVKLQVNESSNNTNKTREVGLDFQFEGTLLSILSLVESIQSSVPVTKVVGVKLIQSETKLTSDLDLTSFWAELPTNLTPVGSPIENISSAEDNYLKQIEGLNGDAGLEVIPALPANRTNPFVR